MSRKSLQVDVGGSRTGRSPSVSPDRGSVPTSPYSVPQIAPMPSSKLCPVCKTTDLMGPGDNFNTCTQCHCKVCNQCGFNPNPHLTEVRSSLERTVPFLLIRKIFIYLFFLCPINQENIRNGYAIVSTSQCVFKWKEQQKTQQENAFVQSAAQATLGWVMTSVIKVFRHVERKTSHSLSVALCGTHSSYVRVLVPIKTYHANVHISHHLSTPLF